MKLERPAFTLGSVAKSSLFCHIGIEARKIGASPSAVIEASEGS
jgi:hypothetical protein